MFIAVFMGVGIGVFLDNFPDGDSLISHAQENARETVILDMNQVTVPSRDVGRSVDFYKRLGLKEIVHSPPTYARFECPGGGATFSISLAEDPVDGPGPTIYFECSDLDERVEKMKADGFEFDQDPEDQRYLWRTALLRDPDGNRLCLYWAGENRRFPPWRIKSADEPSKH